MTKDNLLLLLRFFSLILSTLPSLSPFDLGWGNSLSDSDDMSDRSETHSPTLMLLLLASRAPSRAPTPIFRCWCWCCCDSRCCCCWSWSAEGETANELGRPRPLASMPDCPALPSLPSSPAASFWHPPDSLRKQLKKFSRQLSDKITMCICPRP